MEGGAAGSQLASKAMLDYLNTQEVDPYSSEGKLLMQLASSAVGGVIGGTDGAATALAGEQFNRQLHRKESDWITANAAKYAAQHPGMSVEQAETVLAQQAYRQVQSGASGVWEAAASAFDQRKDSQMFGKQEQTDFYFNKKHGISGTTAEMSASWEGAREAEKKSAQQAAVLMTSSFLRPAVSIYAGVGSSTLLSVAAGRFGAGTIGAGANVSPRGHSDARSLQQRLTIK